MIRFWSIWHGRGGGAHAAFKWALDRLLQAPWLRIDGVSGTSVGAMNIAVLAEGHAAGGAKGGTCYLSGAQISLAFTDVLVLHERHRHGLERTARKLPLRLHS